MFKGGSICGACYQIKYDGDQSQGLGRAGSLVVQVVDSGSWATFDCHMSAFHTITGASTNIFPIAFKMVPCLTSSEGAVAAVLSYDYYWTKFVFGDTKYPVKSAELTVGAESYPMKRVLGYWAAWTGPVDGQVSFTLIDDHGNKNVLRRCFAGWKNRKTGSACTAAGSTAAEMKSDLAFASTRGDGAMADVQVVAGNATIESTTILP